jgi:hypothetical protein
MAVAVRETAHLLNCEFCAVLLPAEDDHRVLKVAAAEAPPLLRSAVAGLTFPLDGPGIVSQVVMSGAPASSSNPLADLDITLRRRQTLEGLGFGHLMANPLTSGGRVVGVLVLANRLDDEPWNAIDDDWLSAIASHLAVAIVLTRSQGQLLAQEAEAVRWLENVLALADPALRRHGEAVGQLAGRLAAALGLGAARVRHVPADDAWRDAGARALPEPAGRPRSAGDWARLRTARGEPSEQCRGAAREFIGVRAARAGVRRERAGGPVTMHGADGHAARPCRRCRSGTAPPHARRSAGRARAG